MASWHSERMLSPYYLYDRAVRREAELTRMWREEDAMSRNLHDMPVSQVEWEAIQAEEASSMQMLGFVLLAGTFWMGVTCGFLAAILVL